MRPLEFRPKSVEDFIGNTLMVGRVVMTKADRIRATGGRFAILFYGPPGTGKTELATVIARSLIEHPTMLEQINGQSLSPDVLRTWQQGMQYRPMIGSWSVKLVDEVDAMSPGAESESITFLDKLPPHWAFICTTNRQLQTREQEKKGIRTDSAGDKLVPFRIHSRMQPFKFKEVSIEEVAKWLQSRWLPSWEDAYAIAMANEGNVRGALNDADTHLDLAQLSAA